jgi:hypothetical protein
MDTRSRTAGSSVQLQMDYKDAATELDGYFSQSGVVLLEDPRSSPLVPASDKLADNVRALLVGDSPLALGARRSALGARRSALGARVLFVLYALFRVSPFLVLY